MRIGKKAQVPGDFDDDDYLALHADVRESGMDPKLHYARFGAKEGRLYKGDTAGDRVTRVKASPQGSIPTALATPVHAVEYIREAPSDENALALFPEEWSSSLPGRAGPGALPLFDDDRVRWLIGQYADVDGWSVLELGPLEGGHTYMLERAGAHVLAIESNVHAFMKCLIVKNTLDLRARFMLGDFTASFDRSKRWDLVLASGVLYHMNEPTRLLEDIAAVADRVFLWTHYYEPEIERWSPALRHLVGSKWQPDLIETVSIGQAEVRLVPQFYGEALGWAGFCGGPEPDSRWIFKEDLVGLLKHLGFSSVTVSFDAPDHPNGPSACFLAER